MGESNRTFGGAAKAFLGIIGMSTVAGILVTVAVAPGLAVTGVAASSSISLFENLPDYLNIGELAEGSNIYATNDDGSTVKLATFYEQNREEVGWDDISQFAKDAAVAAEDPRFYSHNGIDVRGTLRATLSVALKKTTQGGSSITQQYVKNVLVQNAVMSAETEEEKQAAVDAAIDQTVSRKLKEMRYAIGLEKKFSKKEILQGYLNIAPFGGTVYGIEAASKYYFNVSAKDLTLEQAASLLSIVNNPEAFRLDRPESETNGEANGYAENTSRRNYILKRMLVHEKIDQAQYDAAIAIPVTPTITPPSSGCQSAGGSGFFCDYVYWTIRNDQTLGGSTAERMEKLRRGGLDIYTTLDLETQVTTEAAINENVPSSDPRFEVGSASVTIEPATGRILAMAQNKNFSNDPEVLEEKGADWTAVNYNTDFEYGGSSGFQPGSTYKVFTLGQWVAAGHSLRETFDGRRRDFSGFTDSCVGNPGGSFNPLNDDYSSANNAVDATRLSVNSSFMAMAKQLDLCDIKKLAQSFGVHRADGNELEMNPSDVLGTQEVAPLTMAAAFAGIANGGTTCVPRAIDRVVDRHGDEIPIPGPSCSPSVPSNVAAAMAYAMKQTFNGTASESNTWTGVPHIGKTGTTDDAKDTWMIGASTKASTAVWVGNVVGFANLRNVSFESGRAATARHRIFKRIMTVADNKWGGDAFAEPDGSAFRVYQADVPDVRGKSFEEARRILEGANFIVVDGGKRDSDLPAGTVSETNPTGSAPRWSTITVYTSNGSVTKLPNVVGLSEAAALSALSGYDVSVNTKKTSDPSKVGKVLSSSPDGGERVTRGANVTITVGVKE